MLLPDKPKGGSQCSRWEQPQRKLVSKTNKQSGERSKRVLVTSICMNQLLAQWLQNFGSWKYNGGRKMLGTGSNTCGNRLDQPSHSESSHLIRTIINIGVVVIAPLLLPFRVVMAGRTGDRAQMVFATVVW